MSVQTMKKTPTKKQLNVERALCELDMSLIELQGLEHEHSFILNRHAAAVENYVKLTGERRVQLRGKQYIAWRTRDGLAFLREAKTCKGGRP